MMFSWLLWPFELAWGLVKLVFGLIGGAIGLVFGLAGGIISLVFGGMFFGVCVIGGLFLLRHIVAKRRQSC